VKYLLIGPVLLYRRTLARILPPSCKYYPSCSQYALDALRRYGLVRGAILAAWRVFRCNPWSHGGVDHVEDQRVFSGRLA
jgi:putative membrane protein insertion efficiency factor